MTTFVADDLEWTDASLWQQFEPLAEAEPDALALVAPDLSTSSRAELAAKARAIAGCLRDCGVGPGDRVMLEARKNADTAAAALAVSSLDAILCPFAPDLGRSEREVLLNRLNHIAIIERSRGSDEALAGLPGLRVQLRRRSELSEPDPRDESTALIGFTSGTTGVPKGVMHAAKAMNYATRACAHIAGLAAGDAIAGVVPLASAPGFTFTLHLALSRGHPLVLIDPWNAEAALALMERFQCRWAMCVPTQLAAMIEVARSGHWDKPSPLRALAVGGSAMTPELVANAEKYLGIRALRMFGMSECMGHASTRPSDPIAVRRMSDGKSFAGTLDVAFDAEHRQLAQGQRGQAGVRGPSLFLGYAKGLGDSDATFTADGFFLTGDEIVVQPDGYLQVVGRIKDQIIRGGYNIDPAEVEAALLKHPAIAAVAIVAVPERLLGEQACAVCCLRAGVPQPDLEALKQHLQEIGLSKKKWPEHLLIVEELSLTATGKVDKKQMSRMAAAALVGR
ncbi:MAG TPA: class I adenylate-forming enzyme family protein [Burkholderiaceae bacterium]|jgi:acyl-CoA synthetase